MRNFISHILFNKFTEAPVIELTTQQLEEIAGNIPLVDVSDKVDKIEGYSLVPDTEITKLAGIDGGLTQAQILTRQL